MFIDPKELALGQSEPVVDTQTALAAKRRLGTLYKSITQAVRHEAAIMQAVFARPRQALTLFVHRLFEQRIQVPSETQSGFEIFLCPAAMSASRGPTSYPGSESGMWSGNVFLHCCIIPSSTVCTDRLLSRRSMSACCGTGARGQQGHACLSPASHNPAHQPSCGSRHGQPSLNLNRRFALPTFAHS